MRRVLGIIGGTVLIYLSGMAAKHLTLMSINDHTAIFDDFENVDGIWLYSDKIGSSAASSLERAKVAIAGPLGLSASEAVYFIARTDDQRRPLRSQCQYRVSGTPINARWWSITLYDTKTQHYVPSAVNRSSFNSVNVPRGPQDSWQINVSQSEMKTAWLPAHREDGKTFELNLRVYNPSAELRAKLPQINLPNVEMTSC